MTDIPISLERNPATGRLDSTYKSSNYFTVIGSGFGDKTSDFKFFQDFNSVALNSDIAQGANAGGTGLFLKFGGGCSISTSSPHSGTRCWQTKYTGDQQTNRVSLTLGGNQYRKAMLSCWIKFHVNTWTSASADWKFARMGNTAEPYDWSRFDHEYTGNATPTANSMNTAVTIGGKPPSSGGTGASYNPEYSATIKHRAGHTAFLPVADTWYFYQMIGDSGDYLTNNNYFEVFLNGTSVGYFDGSGATDPLKAFRNVDNPDMLRTVLTPVTGLVNGLGTRDVDLYMDELMIHSGWRTAVIADTLNPRVATKIASLSYFTWTDTKIMFEKKYGGFNVGDSVYLHLYDDTFTVFSSQLITLP